jgi:cell division protein ZapA (FtsZ GTPase activity inhibitor)
MIRKTRDELLEYRDELQTKVANLGSDELSIQADKMCAVTALENVYDELDSMEEGEGKVKLYEVPRETWCSMTQDANTLFFFDHIDGMYSYCVNKEGDIVHLGASTYVFMHPDLQLPSPEVV